MGMDVTGAASAASSTTAVNQGQQQTDGLSVQARAKKELDVAIVQSSQAALTVSTTAQNDPLALVYKNAIDRINAELKPTLGDNAIQNSVSQDNTPAGTAASIVSESTAFYSAFQSRHADEDSGDVLNNFMSIIRGAIDKGFSGARDILKGLDVLKGDIASNIDKTYTLVQKGLNDFEASQSQSKTDVSAAAPAETAATA
jgi:hypothetical protein